MVGHHGRCTAVSEQQNLLAAQRNAVFFQRLGKTQDIGVKANRFTVPEGDRVDRVQVGRAWVDLVEQRDDRLLVRDGQVDAGELLPRERERLGELFGRDGDGDEIGVPAGRGEQGRVQGRAHGMAERIAEERVGLALRREGREFFKGQQHGVQPPNRRSASKKSG